MNEITLRVSMNLMIIRFHLSIHARRDASCLFWRLDCPRMWDFHMTYPWRLVVPEPRIVVRCNIYHRDNDEAIAAKPDNDSSL